MTEGDPTAFQNNLKAFLTFWEKKEAGFISYFKEYYAKRVGKHIRGTQYSIKITRLLSCS